MSGQPETLLGRPVIEAVDMPDLASGTFPIAFGDWATAYRVYDQPTGFSVLPSGAVAGGGVTPRWPPHGTPRAGGGTSIAPRPAPSLREGS